MSPNRALSYARSLRGWSQYVVASKIGTSPKNVSRWECGATFPSPYYRELLCQLFELDAQALGLLPLSVDDAHTETSTSGRVTEPRVAITSPPPQLHDGHRFIGHEALLHDLLRQLSSGRSFALTGLPGVGKTALLGKLLQHPQLRERFSDGIIWVDLGPTPNIPRRLSWVAHLLGISMEALEPEASEAERVHLLSQMLQEVLPTRHLLIVLDDVWTIENALPFLIGSPAVTYILTTRLPKVAFALTSQPPYIVPPLSFEASHQLLTTLIPALEAIDSTLQQEIVTFTGGLPLALTLIGKYLAFHSYGGQLRRLENALTQLIDPGYRLHLNSLFLPDTVLPTQNYGLVSSLDETIALSSHHLPTCAQRAFQALSVLPRAPEYFTEEAALAITCTEQGVLDLLVDVGLIEPIQNNCYRIHRIVADYGYYHLKEKAPKVRLVKYMENVCIEQRTNGEVLKQEYSTLLLGLHAANVLGMHTEMIRGAIVLLPLMRIRGETALVDHYSSKVIHTEKQFRLDLKRILS
jgi:transcriptional regulator with XRE-family HTH domain